MSMNHAKIFSTPVFPKLNSGDVRQINLIHSRCRGIRFNLGPHEYDLDTQARHFDYLPTLGVILTLNDTEIRVGLENATLLDGSTDLLGDVPVTELAPELRGALLETLLASSLVRFDAATQVQTRVQDVVLLTKAQARTEWMQQEQTTPLFFRLQRPEPGPGLRGHALLSPAALEILAPIFSRLPLPTTETLPDPGFFGRVILGTTSLSQDLFASLEPHDIVMLDGNPSNQPLALQARFSPHLVIRGVLNDSCLEVEEIMEDPKTQPEDSNATPTLANLDALDVQLTFELGQLNVTLAQLKQLKSGMCLDLQKDMEHPVTIRANGKPVARGEIVQIDERLGVRIVEARP